VVVAAKAPAVVVTGKSPATAPKTTTQNTNPVSAKAITDKAIPAVVVVAKAPAVVGTGKSSASITIPEATIPKPASNAVTGDKAAPEVVVGNAVMVPDVIGTRNPPATAPKTTAHNTNAVTAKAIADKEAPSVVTGAAVATVAAGKTKTVVPKPRGQRIISARESVTAIVQKSTTSLQASNDLAIASSSETYASAIPDVLLPAISAIVATAKIQDLEERKESAKASIAALAKAMVAINMTAVPNALTVTAPDLQSAIAALVAMPKILDPQERKESAKASIATLAKAVVGMKTTTLPTASIATAAVVQPATATAVQPLARAVVETMKETKVPTESTTTAPDNLKLPATATAVQLATATAVQPLARAAVVETMKATKVPTASTVTALDDSKLPATATVVQQKHSGKRKQSPCTAVLTTTLTYKKICSRETDEVALDCKNDLPSPPIGTISRGIATNERKGVERARDRMILKVRRESKAVRSTKRQRDQQEGTPKRATIRPPSGTNERRAFGKRCAQNDYLEDEKKESECQLVQPQQQPLRRLPTVPSHWLHRLQDLVRFSRRHGHCNVSQANNMPSLMSWVVLQRILYREWKEYHGNRNLTNLGSRYTQEQVDLLDVIGFEWEETYGTSVPPGVATHPTLPGKYVHTVCVLLFAIGYLVLHRDIIAFLV